MWYNGSIADRYFLHTTVQIDTAVWEKRCADDATIPQTIIQLLP